MGPRRAIALLSTLLLLSANGLGGASAAHAQSDVDDVASEAERAEQKMEEAYSVVSETVENRDEIELALLEALNEYELAAAELVGANAALERITQSLAFAESVAADTERALQHQAVAAYVEAIVTGPAVMLDTTSVEAALVLDQVFRLSQADVLAHLDQLVVKRSELEDLRTRHEIERNQVEALRHSMEERADRLAELFEQANSEVATAFAAAREAEAEYTQAVDALARAKAAEEERRRHEEAAARAAAEAEERQRSEEQQADQQGEPSGDRPTITTATESWRPLVTQHFAPDLVEDALVIIECESNGDPQAINPYSGAAGLFQFLPGTWAVASVRAGVGDRSVFDGEANIIAASWLAEYYRSRGYDPWRPWTCRRYL